MVGRPSKSDKVEDMSFALALLIVVSGNGTPLAVVGEAFAATGTVLAGLAFILVPLGLYFWTWRRAKAVVA